MDRILLIGLQDEKLEAFLRKLGHELFAPSEERGLGQIVVEEILDLAIIDTRTEKEVVDLCGFLRSDEQNRTLPIMVLSDHRVHALKLREAEITDTECIDIPYSLGSLAGRIATALRLRKMAGADEHSASLSEVNAALRDLNNRFARELEEAQQIQQSLLPKSLPKDPRFELAASYQPLEEVGGDWYYVYKTPSEHLNVLIGDVTGHGLSAAFIGSMTKLAMFAADESDPGQLLAGMNRLMAPHLPEGKFVTMFCYSYDAASGDLRYARAGHLPGFLLRAGTEQVEQLMGDGFALGFFEDSEYSTETASMGKGDVLLVLTDAIPEGLNMQGETFGFERLSLSLASNEPDASVVEVLTKAIEDFDDFREGRILKDDVTLVALKRVE